MSEFRKMADEIGERTHSLDEFDSGYRSIWQLSDFDFADGSTLGHAELISEQIHFGCRRVKCAHIFEKGFQIIFCHTIRKFGHEDG